jgi:hypothetical protein
MEPKVNLADLEFEIVTEELDVINNSYYLGSILVNYTSNILEDYIL